MSRKCKKFIIFIRSLTKFTGYLSFKKIFGRGMIMKTKLMIVGCMLFLVACATVHHLEQPQQPSIPEEVKVQYITMNGEISEPKAEISGLAWYNDYLILLPQYPHIFPSEYDGSLFAIPKAKIAEYLNEVPNTPITPMPISLNAPGLKDIIDGYEGFEALAFYGNSVFFTVESSPDKMMGYLFKGTISGDMKTININIDERVELPPRAPVGNATDETIIVTPDRVITVYAVSYTHLRAHET